MTRHIFEKNWKNFWIESGFKRAKRNKFFLDSSFAYITVNLICSCYSPLYWIDGTINLKPLYTGEEWNQWDDKKHTAHRGGSPWDIMFRAEDFLPETEDRKIMHLDRDHDDKFDDLTVERFFAALREWVVPVLKECVTEEGFFRMYRQRKFRLAGICIQAQRWLEVAVK